MELIHQLGIEPRLFVTQIIGFLILIAVLNKFMFKPLFATIDQRRADIAATYDQMDNDRRLMEETRAKYEKRLADIESEARERIQEAVKEAQALRDSLVADARAQAESIIQQGRNETELERQQAFLAMRQQVVTLAIGAASKVVGESLNDARNNKLVDDFITNIGDGHITARGTSAQNGATAA